ncbi:hypothetical protein SLEP1_g4476 [Rubroshorea leprosula]|uniref:Uncharacterized protein n=1 Tax=Rubroshorea leprosula TaxID=152421 RepID=A0AAV5HNT5_9ROSI|nr:hypothetical protein SLEP1_g4476 [Rubroshorea leprosula]
MLGSVEPSMLGFDETQALGSLRLNHEEGKAAIGFLQVDEDEEGIGAGFNFEPSKQSNLASNPAAAGFLSRWVNGSVEFDLFMDLLSVVLSSYSCRHAGFSGTQRLGSMPSMPGFDETQALGSLRLSHEEGKAAIGFLQVDEDEEGIGAGFDFEPNRHCVQAGFLQVLGLKVLDLISNPAGTGFRFEPSKHWVPFRTQQPLDPWIC